MAIVFHFDHFSGTFASAGRPIIFVSKTKMTDHFTGKPEKNAGDHSSRSFMVDHLSGNYKQEIDHLWRRTFVRKLTVVGSAKDNPVRFNSAA